MITKLESYLLAWYFAAMHTVTDAWEKRKQKGFLFTVGDEPCLRNLPKSAIDEIMHGGSQSSYTDAQLLALAQQHYNVYHLHIMEGSAGHRSYNYWQSLLGQNCIRVDNHQDIAKIIADVVVEQSKYNPAYTGSSLITDSVNPVSKPATDVDVTENML